MSARTQQASDFFELNQYVRSEIDSYLADFFDQKQLYAKKLDPRVRQLVQNVEQVVRRGGKRLRPTLALVGYEAVGGQERQYAVRAAVALELLHAFMLVHDDIMDQDLVRHGGKNLGGIYRRRFAKKLGEHEAAHMADSLALLGGDLLLSWVFEVLADMVEPTRLPNVIKLITQATFDTAAGQQMDVMSSLLEETTSKQALKVPYYKTGLYSFVNPLQFGAVLAGEQPQAVFRDYGANLGVAFQLIDDDLGMFGSSRQTGKPVQSDLEENKATLLKYYGFRLASAGDRQKLKQLFGKKGLTIQEVKLARIILTDCGARAKNLVIAQSYGDKAVKALQQYSIDSQANARLIDLVNFCLKRNH